MVEWKNIDDISTNVFAGGTPSTKHEEYYDGDIPWIRSGEIDFNTITKAERNITQEGYNNSSAKLIRSGSVVMAMTGATVAKSAIVEFETSANQSVCAIETDESVANYKYVYFYLSKNYFEIKSSAQGALTSLNLSMIKQIEIPIPSLEEQTRIVGILDTFTSAIDNLKEQIAQRRKQYEYYRDQLLDLEGKEGVEVKKLGDVCDTLSGFPFDSNQFSENGIRLMRGMNVKRGYFDFSEENNKYWSSSTGLEKYLLEANDIIISMDGSLVGRSFCYLNQNHLPLLLVQRVARIRTKENYKYIYHYLAMRFPDYVDKKKTAGAIPHISMKDINSFLIPLPNLTEQSSIASILDTFEASIQNLEAQLALREKQYEYYRNKLLTFE